MTIYSGSRYATSKITAVQTSDGVVKPFVHSRKVFGESDIGPSGKAVNFESGSELDLLAYNSWKIEEKWWFIADVNNIMFPLFDSSSVGPNQLHIGSSIQVPDKSTMDVLTS